MRRTEVLRYRCLVMKRPFIVLAGLGLAVFSAVWSTSTALSAQRVVHPRETRTGKVWKPIENRPPFRVHQATQNSSVRVTMADLRRWETELSNWGRCGLADQRGTLNLITPAKSREAARLAMEGVFASRTSDVRSLCRRSRLGSRYRMESRQA